MVAAKRSGVLGARAGRDATARQQQRELFDMVAEPALAVMVLAMHVGGDHPAHGHELGARHDGRKEAAAHEAARMSERSTPASTGQPAGSRVEGPHPVEPARR
jgi:hypothetical protein